MSLPVRTTPEAEVHIRAIDDWWRRHRVASPDMFLDEFAAACELIAAGSLIGHPYRKSPVTGTRRVLLTGTRYHVYSRPLTLPLSARLGVFVLAEQIGLGGMGAV